MSLEPWWNREIHDEELKRLHAKKFSEFAISEIMEFSPDTVRANLRRLGLGKYKVKPVREVAQEIPPSPPKEKPNPLALARIWLGRRLVEKPSGYWLDGLPVGLAKIMVETNRLLKASGCEMIGPEKWRV